MKRHVAFAYYLAQTSKAMKLKVLKKSLVWTYWVQKVLIYKSMPTHWNWKCVILSLQFQKKSFLKALDLNVYQGLSRDRRWLDGSRTLRQFSVYNLITPERVVTMWPSLSWSNMQRAEWAPHMDLILNHKTLRQSQTLTNQRLKAKTRWNLP